ncbi:MAG: hypothetical protein ACK4FV_06025 [Candidatus Nitrosocaldus sp.]
MVEVLWFDDIEPLRQPVFDFPLLGRISMKQMGIVGSALMIALASKDILIAMLTIAIALPIAMIRYKAVSMDELIYSLILYVIRHRVRPLIEIFMDIAKASLLNKIMLITSLIDRIGIGRRSKSKKANVEMNNGGYADDDNILVFNFNPVRLRLRLLTRDGKAIANRLARIYVDDVMLTSITSDHNGELDVILTLKDTMKTPLTVYVDGYNRPLFERVIVVRPTY